ncbi:recombinase family protein [Roseibium sediminicola]|uniref:Recombinase family protein n=1 Tax=Roseibium sediminicola TaxID=2933272 RepID=A0ABT0H2X6_9HYPH|nr:recombinase family protein [Roseibium sp. CAU 1639]MCK7616028.1 recombinase family protein [Roseibium sp. CAU 1639]
MLILIGAMAELESSLITESVIAGMKAAAARGKHLGRPPLAPRLIAEIETLVASTGFSVRQIHGKIAGKASRGRVVEIVKRIRSAKPQAVL